MNLVMASADDETLLLDLLNTTPVVDGVPRDDLAEPKAARAWMRTHGVKATDAELAGLLDARSGLQNVIRGKREPRSLHRFVESVTLRPAVTNEGLDWQLVAKDGRTGALRAVLAWDALRLTSPGRLRPCANDECRLFLIDRSKPNTGRWCSMAICGNRMKARRHYRKSRES
jgi:predicted RNA-binding Zn ribbon-like protein